MKYKMEKLKLYLVITCINWCKGVSLRRQLEHIATARALSQGLYDDNYIPSRRSFYEFDPREVSSIVGVPSRPNHLPEAEPILPGHTLIRPSLGMLKSAVKFPHKELDEGAGVYGNIDSLGLRYDMKNERVLTTGFRRSAADYIMVLPSKSKDRNKLKFQIASTVLDTDKKDFMYKLKKALEKINVSSKTGDTNVYIASLSQEKDPFNHIKLTDNTQRQDDFEAENSKEKLREWWFNSQYLSSIPGKNEQNQIDETKLTLRNNGSLTQMLIGHSDSSEEEPTTTPKEIEEDPKKQKIKKWYLNSQNAFDHIKISDDAPDQEEFLPKDSKMKIRPWWFFNQHDYKTFSDELPT